MVSRTLLHAAGYNVPHNEPIRFRRGDVTIDSALIHGAKGEGFTDANLDSVLAQGATHSDSSYSAFASLFIPGHVLGSPSMNRLRPGDTNDWYSHRNRRELRGLYASVLVDQQLGHRGSSVPRHVHRNARQLSATSSTTFSTSALRSAHRPSDRKPCGRVTRTAWTSDGSGGGSCQLGFRKRTLAARSPVYRNSFGWATTSRRSTGLRTSERSIPQPAFREMTDRDGYWGAKIVASFSDEQIAAAVEAAHYEDPRASAYPGRRTSSCAATRSRVTGSAGSSHSTTFAVQKDAALSATSPSTSA